MIPNTCINFDDWIQKSCGCQLFIYQWNAACILFRFGSIWFCSNALIKSHVILFNFVSKFDGNIRISTKSFRKPNNNNRKEIWLTKLETIVIRDTSLIIRSKRPISVKQHRFECFTLFDNIEYFYNVNCILHPQSAQRRKYITRESVWQIGAFS